jgi:hypothetical protein
LSELGSRLSPRSRADLAARKRDFEHVAEAMPAIVAIRERNWRRALSLFIARPSVAATCIRLLRTRVVRSWSAFR